MLDDTVVRRLANVFRSMGVDNPVTVATCLLQWGALKQHFIDKLKNNSKLDVTPNIDVLPHELMTEYEYIINYQEESESDNGNNTINGLYSKLNAAVAVEDYIKAAKIKNMIDKIYKTTSRDTTN